ncbi:endo-1,4-beta-xylanase [Aquisphaera insulae]|uniref:endo-1,4-beta-xylanase n=1 Tax=Aquisphaera insulae TaxID=2712864 RepID=UPI0013ED8D90|nr:endo-1,4-beta-xylanase [Aquisphaera insulae]
MGVLKFNLPANDVARRLPGFRKAYVTGLDRTPARLSVEFRNGLMSCFRETTESGRLFVPWPIAGYGMPIVGTATLAERQSPYVLALELARGKLNDVRNQMADWVQLGLRIAPELSAAISSAHKGFVAAALSSDDAEACLTASQASLEASSRAGELLTEAYLSQILQNRLSATGKLSTHLGCVLSSDPDKTAGTAQWPSAFNACQLGVSWRQLAPSEGKYRWDQLDARLAWCRKNRLEVEGGPLIEFRAAALPDWIWLWEGDHEAIGGFVIEFVRQAVLRYRGKVPHWHVVHRPASQEILGLSEEEQIRITARAIQTARQADPSAQFSIGIDRPWAEWMSQSHFQLGPLHLCDYLLRSDLGISSIALEIAPGYTTPGSHLRDLFDLSRLLDLYSLLNVPLHLMMAVPAGVGPDPQADPSIAVDVPQWPSAPDEALQSNWGARWLALGLAKPFVRSVTWMSASDAQPHVYPHSGIFRSDGTPRPLFAWLQSLRKDVIA